MLSYCIAWVECTTNFQMRQGGSTGVFIVFQSCGIIFGAHVATQNTVSKK